MEVSKPSSLQELEAVIGKGIASFVESGNALREIRDQRLYEGFPTFEEYCRTRWKMGRNYVNKQIATAGVVQNLGTNVPTPLNEAQARELSRLPVEQQREIATTINLDKVTAAQIRERVRQELKTMKATTPKRAKATQDAVIERMAHGIVRAGGLAQPISKEQLGECVSGNGKALRSFAHAYRAIRTTPWVRLRDVAGGKIHVTIDLELKDICERRRNGGELPMEFATRLYKEFTRRRKEADLGNKQRVWNPDAVSKLDLMKIIVWMEGELQTYINGPSINGPSVNAREKAVRLLQQEKKGQYDNQNGFHDAPAHTGTSTTI